jgi:copper transport protein
LPGNQFGPRRWGTFAPLAVTAAVVAVVLCLGAAPAAAHATLIATTPGADELIDAVPERVELRFDEPVEALDDAVRVFGPDGRRVDRARVETADGGATVRAGIDPGSGDAEGTYTVAWRVTSEDSHTLSGSFVFHVGTRTGAVDFADGDDGSTELAGGIGRWLGFAGTFVAVGAGALALVASVGTDRHRGPDAGADTGSDSNRHRDHAVRRRLRPLALVGALVGAVGVLVALVASVAESAGRSLFDAVSLVPDLAAEGRTGQLALARAGLGLAAAGAAAIPALWRRTPVPALVLAFGSLVTASLAGHAWTASSRALAVASDVAHLGAVAVWIGGLVALLVALPVAADPARLAGRFSALALGLVAVVAVSGTVSGLQQVRTLEGLTSTGYGQLLLAKIAGVAVLVAIGWANRSRLVPLVRRTVTPLTRSLRVEALVAGAVLALTAALVHQPPARAGSTGPFTSTVAAEAEAGATAGATLDATLDVTVDPARAGSNDIHLYFLDGGGPLAVDAVQVTAATSGVPARRLPVTPVTADHVSVVGASLPSPATWTVEVTAVRAGATLIFSFEVPIR